VRALSLNHCVRQYDEAQPHEHPNEHPSLAQCRTLNHEAVARRQHEPARHGVEDAQPPVAEVLNDEEGERPEPSGNGGEERGEDNGPGAHFGDGIENRCAKLSAADRFF
jgi:hypothetical protein